MTSIEHRPRPATDRAAHPAARPAAHPAARACIPAPGRTEGRTRAGAARRRTGTAVLVCLALAACGGGQSSLPPGAGTGLPPAPAAVQGIQPGPSAAGRILRYDSYEAAVAREGESIDDIAGRLGLSGAELAGYNGLTPDTRLSAGAELVLPPRTGGWGGTPVAYAPLGTAGAPATAAAGQAGATALAAADPLAGAALSAGSAGAGAALPAGRAGASAALPAGSAGVGAAAASDALAV
ncbi:MAG: LysM domain-containing protein, partial [Pseudomonadota bacterium]